ncbi:hypothetical protein M409DRAFT_21871 [Zasmidium cellare ATCC 36951]|uniref:BTB domain-containing protein n=1 Tax=Zasmidium cellare ATCC 36951 TaxID=1080233 RepID=A0A6A6CPM8_ZASCE|nr:uncharacterized protein M409DRAFT_21871 [Zasmidium cellare ATCC 36951]KAF2167719.1 hypothetical protein M409DRAFT_21871 [Zasmidium cellare ATCC 36951]
MASQSIVEIAPRGDVVLVCGSAACTKLRVESKVLALASPVFQAMFDEKKFHEGTTLASYGFVEIALPDDDPLPTKTICQVLHMRFNVLGEHLRPKDLVDIGIVADKYDCSRALSGPAYFWFSRLVDAVDDSGRTQLFIAAYLLKQDQLFRQISHDMVMKTSNNVLPIAYHAEYPMPLQEAVGALNRQRSTLGVKIVRFIEDAVLDVCDDGGPGQCTPECPTVMRGTKFVLQLRACNLCPPSKILIRPLEQTCMALECFQPFEESLSGCSGGSVYWCKGAFLKRSATIKQEFSDMVKETEQNALRLCLKCVQSGEIQQGKCEKDHSK